MNIKAVVFDADGVVINSPGYFSVQYQKEFGVSNDVMLPFFKGVFQECLVGKADLKEELKSVLNKWEWNGSVDDLLDYWFEIEHYIDGRVLDSIDKLKKKGIKCFLGTKQERYRTKYMEKEMGFSEIFDDIYSSAEVGYKKPDKKFFDFINKELDSRWNIKPGEIMFWDDDLENVEAAGISGWSSYLYKNFEDFDGVVSKLY